ncbi:hypothetical protein [Bacillus sp. SG-1]|uniref:hypothetical protein n=1 Tax=Bacillus sp. SG-1 TaxID=161544 RepID=UPI0001543E92|nr:hypothetical protein [Bacillus sp. SG-1]EDL65006.1 hypothetical protein BSG1_14834 [Bacillus sp. SG-1]
MKEAEKQVDDFIKENFVTESFEIEDFPLFPYGKLLRDETGETMVCYYDLITGQVKTEFE